MQIRDWMTTDVVTATPDTSMLKVSKMMKEYNIRRVPVVDPSHRVIGIISDRDVKDASPSKATTLDMHELYYLLSEVKARDIMTPNPVTVSLRDTVERVALLMLERGIGGLPVVDDNGLLVGIITDHDLFKILVEVSGVRKGGVQIAVAFQDGVGVLLPLFDLLRSHNASLVSMLTADSKLGPDMREVYVRIKPMERSEENRLIEDVKAKFHMLYWVRENVHEV